MVVTLGFFVAYHSFIAPMNRVTLNLRYGFAVELP